MARSFALPAPYGRQGWKLKIRDRERVEPPHVTVLFRTRAWRYGLRESGFLDREPAPGEVPERVVEFIVRHLPQLIAAWDELYPHNRVRSEDA